MKFIALVAGHLPSPYETIIFIMASIAVPLKARREKKMVRSSENFDFPTMKATVKRVMNKFLTSLLFMVPKANMLLFRSGLNKIGVGTLCICNEIT